MRNIASPDKQRTPNFFIPHGAALRGLFACALFGTLAAAIPAHAQAPAKPRYVSVIGTVENIDPSAKTFHLKNDKGGDASIKFDDRTQFLLLPAGDLDVKKATRAAAADLGPGDRAIARMHSDDVTGLPAVFVYFSKKTDLAAHAQKTREEWQTEGIAGTVKSVDTAAKHIMISVRGGFGPPKEVTLDATGPVDFMRYSPDTGKYEASAITAVQPGDQVRVLGKKNADETEIKLEAIMSGSFKTIPVQIKSIDVAANTILATNLSNKQPITIDIRPDTTMKRLDDETATLLARRLNPTFKGSGRGGRGQGSPDAGAQNPAFPPRSGNFAGGRGAGRGGDPTKMLEQQPTIAITDLKEGEPIVVTGAGSNDLSKLSATTLIAGVDPILRAAPENGPDPLGGNWNFGDIQPPQ